MLWLDADAHPTEVNGKGSVHFSGHWLKPIDWATFSFVVKQLCTSAPEESSLKMTDEPWESHINLGESSRASIVGYGFG